MAMILFYTVYTLQTVHSLILTISGQAYIEPGVPYNISCTVDEYRDNRQTSFSAKLSETNREETIVWYYKPYGCFQWMDGKATECRNASCSCDDNGLTTHWTYNTPSNLTKSVTFSCISTNNNSYIVQSDVLVPTIPHGPGSSLVFNSSNDFETKVFGQEFSVTCFGNCNPSCQFQWTKLTSVVSTGATLHIPNLSKDDSGTYVCRAENGYGKDGTKAMYLTVNYGPESVTLLPPNTQYTVTEGNNISPINCTADCRPACNQMWSGPNVPADTSNILHLQNIHRNQRGVFNCTASNVVGSMKSFNVNLDVQFGPGSSLLFNPYYTSVTKTKGDSFGSIACKAICNPPCHYKWTKPDKSSINDSILMIKSLPTEDHGSFICTASNGVGDGQSKRLDVTVNYGPAAVIFSPPTKQFTVIQGNNVPPINCTANCRPECKYIWFGPHVPSDTKNVLSLENIQKNQRGDFNCTASNEVSSMQSAIINVNVQFGPGSSLTFNPSNTSVTKRKGDKLGPIECTATCNPPCQYNWTKPDRAIINDGKLTIESISTNDHGSFICTASNGIGDRQSKYLDVIVNYGPVAVTLSTPTKIYTVRHGQNISPINCTANCRPVCQYMWSGPNVPSDTNNVLSLQNIKKNQSGDFYCTAANEIGSMQSSIINVNVQYEPIVNRVTINGTNFTVSENTTVILSCNYEGNPAPKLTWKKNNIILNEDDENNGRSFYTINTVRCADHGNYSCVANNSLGLSSAQQSLFVTCFPRLNVYIQQPPRRKGLSIGENLNLTVNIIAYPKLLKVNWTFQPSTSSDDEGSNNYTTSLKSDLFTHVVYFYKYHLKKGDFGNYTLEIQNDIGGIAVHFYVDRAGLPDPPTDLLVICETSPMVVLWKPGFNGGTPQWFTVIWKDLKTNTSMVSSSIPDTDNGRYVKVATSSLSEGTTYIIYVEASNKYGRVRTTIHDNCTTKSAQFIQSENYAAVGVGAGIGTSLLILILAAIFVFIFKRLRRRKNTEGNAIYEATQSGSRELSANEDHLYNDLQQCEGDNTNKQRDPATYANLSF